MAGPVSITGSGGAALARGDVITTFAGMRAVVVENDFVRVTFEDHVAGVTEAGAHTLYVRSGGTWNRVVSTQYGDWAYFGVSISVDPDRCTVVTANDEVVELAIQWDAFSLAAYSGGGVPIFDYSGNPLYNSGAVLQRISSTTLTKTIRVERDREGYFIGWHSNPLVGPQNALAYRNGTDWGERELGTGSGSVVAFSSAGFSSHHPEWGADARWAAAEAATGGVIFNRAAWMGIADPSYSIWSNAAVIATQNTGFPHYQTTGPWWVADLAHSSVSTIDACRFLSFVQPTECGVWQFGAGQYGAVVAHYVNEHRDARNVPYPYQVFFGAFPYASPDTAAEPIAALTAEVARRVSRIVWPDSDTRSLSPTNSGGTSAASIRDVMRTTIRALIGEARSDVRFRAHDERSDFRTWADSNPTAAFRVFSIKTAGSIEPPTVSNTDVEWVDTEFEVVTAYPRDFRYGAQHTLDLDDVVESDLRQIEHAIGTNGYAAIDTSTGGDATVTTISTFREPGSAVVFGVLRLRVQFWRSMSA